MICGLTGWCLEILWTGLCSLKKKELKLTANTSIWMFPIYGMASCIAPLSHRIKHMHALVRGGIYACFIFTGEFFTGAFLKKHNMCPWDYSHSKLNIKGIIRLDYAPLWIIVGLLYEKLLEKQKNYG